MKQRVVYFNRGTKCLIRLLVSMFSLRKHYAGDVVLLQEGPLPVWVEKNITQFNVTIQPMNEGDVSSSLFLKSRLWSYLPETGVANVYLDSDTLVREPLDSLFSQVANHSLVFTSFSDWKTRGRKISGRIREWERVIGAEEVTRAINYGEAINTGVFGFTISSNTIKFMEEWQKICRAGMEKRCSHKVLDEIAAQVLLHKHPHHIADSKWNASVRFFGEEKTPAIIHYHGMKHVGGWKFCDLWKNDYWEYRNTSNSYDKLGESMGDRRFRVYLGGVVKSDLTIVSAFNKKYFPGFLKNFTQWMETEGLREQRYIVFVKGFRSLATETRPIRKYKNIKFVMWEFPAATSEREEMLSSFVFGPAAHVKTKYWMKLDGDCSPKKQKFTFPDYQKHTIVAHPWGYTKMKADDNAKKHWLNILDDWWGKDPIFSTQYSPVTDRKVRHSRFCSFCYFEQTHFTQNLAARCGTRLPIPSQDTLTWYVATQQKESVGYANMKSQIRSA